MNIGKRIEQRLADIGWSRKQLLESLPELSPQALSNLIVRDSKRSEWDIQIAKALGVSVLWLVYGEEASYSNDATQNHSHANSQPAPIYEIQSPATRKVLEIMTKLEASRQMEVVSFAEERLALQSINQNSTRRVGQ